MSQSKFCFSNLLRDAIELILCLCFLFFLIPCSPSSQLGILGFEIANIMVRIITLRAALTEEDIKELKDEVLSSDGVKVLVSEDDSLLWKIAAEDKRQEIPSDHFLTLMQFNHPDVCIFSVIFSGSN